MKKIDRDGLLFHKMFLAGGYPEGHTYPEVYEMLEYYNVTDKEKELKEWYDGYIFGSEEPENIYSLL